MQWQRFFGCLLAILIWVALPNSSQAAGFHNGGGGGSRGGGPAFAGGRGFGAFHGPMGRGGWNHGNWAGGNWSHGGWHHGDFRHDHFHDGRHIIFVSGFGGWGPWWGYPWWWDYPPYYYSYYYPYYGDPYYGGSYGGPDPSYGGRAYYRMSGEATYSYRTSPGGENTAVQLALRRQGYYRGPIDGDIGPASERAIRSFQRDNDLPVTGTVDSNLLRALRVRV